MTFRNFRPVLELVVLCGVTFVCHAALLAVFTPHKTANFHYSLPELYGFFFCCSAVITLILIQVKRNNIDSVGHAFMLLTCLKIAVAYLMLRPILNATNRDVSSEKIHFFIVFALFLTIETIVTVRLLNKTT